MLVSLIQDSFTLDGPWTLTLLAIILLIFYILTLVIWMGHVRPACPPLSEHQGAAPQLRGPGLDSVKHQRIQHLTQRLTITPSQFLHSHVVTDHPEYGVKLLVMGVDQSPAVVMPAHRSSEIYG